MYMKARVKEVNRLVNGGDLSAQATPAQGGNGIDWTNLGPDDRKNAEDLVRQNLFGKPKNPAVAPVTGVPMCRIASSHAAPVYPGRRQTVSLKPAIAGTRQSFRGPLQILIG